MAHRWLTEEESAKFWSERPKELGDGSIISIPTGNRTPSKENVKKDEPRRSPRTKESSKKD